MRKMIVWILKIIVAGILNFGILCVIGEILDYILRFMGITCFLFCFEFRYTFMKAYLFIFFKK